MNIANGTMQTDSNFMTVSEINKLARDLLEKGMPSIWIRGEISSLKTYAHLYFDLKDSECKISCVMFSRYANNLNFKLENGKQVELKGKITIYPANGSFQINVEEVRDIGVGRLWIAYNELVNKLKNEGLFDEQYKKQLPIFPRAIGVVTSREGAVIRDIITTISRRAPYVQIVIYHTAVQGIGVGIQIANMIDKANQRSEVDVLIVARGGGSIEDLWCFNEEVVARSVFASTIPVISAVGHETDTTIIDFVADLRAPTPTAAAEIVAKDLSTWLNLLQGVHYRLNNGIDNLINNKRQMLDMCHAKLNRLNPLMILQQKGVMLNNCKLMLNKAIKTQLELCTIKIHAAKRHMNLNKILEKLAQNRHKINISLLQMKRGMANIYRIKIDKILYYREKLNLINPHYILNKGYGIVEKVIINQSTENHANDIAINNAINQDGQSSENLKNINRTNQSSTRVVKSKSQLKVGDQIRLKLQDGAVCAIINEV